MKGRAALDRVEIFASLRGTANIFDNSMKLGCFLCRSDSFSYCSSCAARRTSTVKASGSETSRSA